MHVSFISLPLFIIFLGVIAIARLVLLFQRRARHQLITDPVCGKCGYCVRGIVSLTCPECGSDLREVGIVPPGVNRPAAPRNSKWMWTLALPVPAMAISWLLVMTVLPYTQTQKISRTIFCQAPFLNTTLQVLSTQRLPQPVLMSHNPAPPEQIFLFCPLTNGWMDINLKTGAYSSFSPNGPRVTDKSGGFNGTAIANWLSSPALNASDPRLLDLSQSIYGTLTEIPQVLNAGKFTTMYDPTGKQIGIAHPAFSNVVHDEPSPFVIAGLGLFWIIVWLYGLRKIHRRSTATVSTV